MTKKRSLSPNHFIFIPKMIKKKKNTYILSRKMCKKSERKYFLIKILIFIGKIIYKNYFQQKIWGI